MLERIESYTDYRAFLRDYFEDMKSRFPFFSNRYFCNKAGIKSPSLYKEVVEGKRNLTSKTIHAFAKGLSLTQADTSYFELLVKFGQSRGAAEKQEYLERLRGLRRRVKQRVVPVDLYEYYTRWYHPVIRELVCTLAWGDDFGLLARAVSPPIKKSEAHESVDMLLRLGFVKRYKDGTWTQAHPAITTGSEVCSLGIRSLNKHLSVLGAESIDRFFPSERDVSSLTIGISSRGFSQIKEEIQEFKRRVIRIVDDDSDSDRVFTLNVQLFPVSAPSQREERNDD